MNLKFNEGDIVLVKKQNTLENNDIGVVLIDNSDATVKKYKRENDIVLLEPMSTDTNNTTQIYNIKNTNIQILGKVIHYQGNI
ncbi:MAG: hypothetical protein FWC68_01780 [Oscillospiraceae bacterium]|nr:hypothetical protein [Oscillospiraceae bacterium]